MIHEIAVVVVGVLIAELLYDRYRRWTKVRHMRELNRRKQAKAARERAAKTAARIVEGVRASQEQEGGT